MNNTLKKPDDYTVLPMLQRYGYDQLNRIADSRAFNDYDFVGNQWNASASPLDKYATSYNYDPAGNLLSLNRNGDKTDTLEMDSLKYVYYANTNRLRRVQDVVDASNYGMDIDAQDTLSNNYGYDAIGNLISDEAEEIGEIEWTVYGKVSKVVRSSGSTKPDLEFYYDAGGKRIMKKIIPKTDAPEKTELYVHDAQGNPLTIYSYLASDTPTYKVNEQMIYGSSRLGLWKSGLDLLAYIPEVPEIQKVDRGNKRYEMNDHLSNVHTVVTDRRKRICEDEVFTNYEADIQNTYDYYAFGMMMPGRGFSAAPVSDSVAVPLTDTLYHGTFTLAADTAGWVPQGNATVSVSGQKLLIATPTPISGWGAYMQFPLEAGRTYNISFWYNLPYNTGCAKPKKAGIRVSGSGDVAYDAELPIDSGTITGSFTPVYTGLYSLSFSLPDTTCSDSLWVDDILITSSDTSYNTYYDTKSGYRFGFNGQMKVDEVYGDANAYDFGARLYDPRIGRWLAVDPLAAKYSFVSPYQFVNNCPLKLVDPDGKEWVNGYDAQVASLNKQKLDNPDSKKIQRQLNAALNNQAAVNEMIGKIKTNDVSLYNYIENLQVSDIKTKEIVNVKVTVSLDYLSGRDGIESAKTSYSNFKKNGGQRYVEYKGLEGNYAPAPIDKNGDIGFDVVMFADGEWADIPLANEAGDVMFRMEYPQAAYESGFDNTKRDESGELDRGKYLKPGSAGKYSWDVQELYRARKKSGEGTDPKNNPYPKKNE